jgi:uncharacterized protein YndB with AHSA1/START domain
MKLEMRQVFPAERNKVFKAWSDPDIVSQWFHPPGSTLRRAEIDFHVGGSFRFHLTNPEQGDFMIFGIYQEIEVPDKLVFTWNNRLIHEYETVVTLVFVEAGVNQTELFLTQDGFVSELIVGEYRQGWLLLLSMLETSIL